MKNKTFWLAVAAVYIVGQAAGFLVHQVMLADTYQALAHLWRPEAEMMGMMWMMFVTGALYSFFFCLIYSLGFAGNGVAGGVKYGLLIGLFMSVPMAIDNYVIYPIPSSLALSWMISGLAMFVIYGAIVGAIYKR